VLVQEALQRLVGPVGHAPHLVGVGQIEGEFPGVREGGQGLFQGGRGLLPLVLPPLEVGQFHGDVRGGKTFGQLFQGFGGFVLFALP